MERGWGTQRGPGNLQKKKRRRKKEFPLVKGTKMAPVREKRGRGG